MSNHCRLYIISPEKFELDQFSVSLENALQGADVASFQLRMKNISDDEIIKAAKVLKPICHKYSTMFIVNDRADIAAKVGADGVHIGEDKDGTYENARKIVGNKKIVGVSCYGDIDRALDFAEKGADYVAFGAFYPTKTKEPKARPDPEILRWWRRNVTVPCVAIGGIKANNCQNLVSAGADFIAVVSAIWEHEKGSKIAVQELYNSIVTCA